MTNYNSRNCLNTTTDFNMRYDHSIMKFTTKVTRGRSA
jgi:hypothetical protein